ncbi:MAG: hypothetical protein JNL70_24465 [Saprospiraceae bacterium]|nr:hypothetical protein [Saprospiraceae bacterium]
MENLPIYIPIVFTLTTGLTVIFFSKATPQYRMVVTLIFAWLLIQSLVSLTGFYTVTNTLPPRFLLLVLPPVILIAALFFTIRGKAFLDTLDPSVLTLLHVVRVPVELVLWWLFLHKAVPELMTFEGRNFDILSGLSAPIIYYWGMKKGKISKNIQLLWHFVCLGLLINIVATAILSAPTPLQQFAFEQPNIAVFHFPYVWLPCCIVPLVLWSHLVVIRYLFQNYKI